MPSCQWRKVQSSLDAGLPYLPVARTVRNSAHRIDHAGSTEVKRAMPAFKQPWFMLAVFLCLIAINGGFFAWAWLSSYGISSENGPIENFQVLILGLALVTYVLIFSKQDCAAQTLAAVFSYVCFFLILKELDFRELQAIGPGIKSHWIEKTIPEQIRKFLKFFGLLLLIGFLIRRNRDIPTMVRAVISWSAWPLYLSFALLVLSLALEHPGFRNPGGLTGAEIRQALDEFHQSQAIGKFWEELIELNAYMVLLYAAQSSAAISCLINSCVNVQSKSHNQNKARS